MTALCIAAGWLLSFSLIATLWIVVPPRYAKERK